MSINFGHIEVKHKALSGSGSIYTSGLLQKRGGTMSGELNMGNNKIINLKIPTDDTDASTKKYVDDLGDTRLDLAGGAMTGPLGLGNGRLWDVATPTLDMNGANKKYVDDQDTALKALCVLKAGSTMSGVLNMDNNKITSLKTPTDDKDASTKKYVNDQDALQVSKSGDTMSGILNMGTNKRSHLIQRILYPIKHTQPCSNSLREWLHPPRN